MEERKKAVKEARKLLQLQHFSVCMFIQTGQSKISAFLSPSVGGHGIMQPGVCSHKGTAWSIAKPLLCSVACFASDLFFVFE